MPVDIEDEEGAQAHVKGLAGACMAMGLRFAGTHHLGAAAAVKEQLLYFLACKKLVPDARGSLLRLRASFFLTFRITVDLNIVFLACKVVGMRGGSSPSGPSRLPSQLVPQSAKGHVEGARMAISVCCLATHNWMSDVATM